MSSSSSVLVVTTNSESDGSSDLSTTSTFSASTASSDEPKRKRKSSKSNKIEDNSASSTKKSKRERSQTSDKKDEKRKKKSRSSRKTKVKEEENNVSVKSEDEEAIRLKKMTDACGTILECIGEDPTREGLVKTPDRWAKALLFMTKGYCQTVKEVTNDAIFQERHSEMVVVRDIDIHSLCEHHMVPFTGKIHVGYIPNGKVIGLSKIARIAEVFSRRLQVQERLTREIAEAIVEAVNPLGVGVVIECKHFCMVMRGVEKCSASTVSSSVKGVFEKNSKTRAEFFSIINSNRMI